MSFFFMASLAALTRAFGDFRDPIYALLTAVLLGFVWRGFPVVMAWPSWINFLLRWSSWAVFVGLLAIVHPVLGLVLLTAAIWGFEHYSPAQKQPSLSLMLIAGALYSVWWTVIFQLPVIYRIVSDWSFGYSYFITQTMSTRLILGPSASGLDLLILGICGIVAVTLMSQPRRWVNAVFWVIALEAGRVLYIWMAPTLLGIISQAIPTATTPHLDLPGIYFLFVVLVVLLAARTIESSTVAAGMLRPRSWRERPVLASAMVLLLAFIIAGAASYGSGPVRVLFLSNNQLDVGVPEHGRYGDRSGGMFGFLPLFLEGSGNVTYRRKVTREVLDSVDVIFVANLLDKIPEDQRNMIWEFIEDGGGLLIVGDHTGTEAIRDPTNDLLSPCGMELNFDTAVPYRRSWVSAKSFLFHPLGRSGGEMDAELWLGASVTPGPHGETFVVGRGAFSDPGDMANEARSYLGNLTYDAGEPVGDIPLAAAAHWGKGKAVLHGDTSPYQNGTIIRSHGMINRTLQWMTNDSWVSFIDRWRSELLFLLIGIGGTSLVVLSFSQPIWLVTALLVPALSVGVWSMIPGGDAPAWKSGLYRQALMDEGHGEMFDLMAWEPKSIGGLQYNLLRNGFSPRFVDGPSEIEDGEDELYLLAAPTQALSDDEVDRLVEFAENGGWVIASAGWNTYPAVRDLYDEFGIAVENVPLGASDGTSMSGVVKMADAYPVTGDSASTLIEAFGYPVGKVATRGKGGLIAIGDSQFLYCKNLEGQNEQVVMENVRFFRQLMESTFKVTAGR